MPVLEGAAEAARNLAFYLAAITPYEANLTRWQKAYNNHAALVATYDREEARYVRLINAWNIDRIGARPEGPGPRPRPFAAPRPPRPIYPAPDGFKEYQNNTAPSLPLAKAGSRYYEARVGEARDGGAGRHRIAVLAEDHNGNIMKRYCTPDHYGDRARATRPSWTEF